MTEALPKGIVTSTENISSEIEALDRVDIEDIAQLWRVYSTNRAVLEHDTGSRLENFFWRIWSNGRIYQNIRGSTVARLFLHISQSSGFIRTTPTQSPRGNQSSIQGQQDHSASPTDRVTFRPDHVGAAKADSDVDVGRGTRQPSDASRQTLPPPILKKPRSGSDEPPKTARIVSPKQTGVDFAWVPTQQGPRPPSPLAESSGGGKNGRKKTSFVASTTTSRRRPAPTRRKSSQSSISTTSSTTSPRLQAEGVTPFQPAPPPAAPQPRAELPPRAQTREANPVFSLSPPATSWQDVESSETSSTRVPLGGQSAPDQLFTGDQPVDWLVDRDFRSRFVDRRLREERDMSFGGLAQSTLKGGAAPDLIPSRAAKGKGRGTSQERRSRDDPISSRLPMTPSAVTKDKDEGEEEEEDDDDDDEGEGEEDEDEDEEEDEEPRAALPRSKSQLSLMIERERRASEGSGKGKEKEKARKTSP